MNSKRAWFRARGTQRRQYWQSLPLSALVWVALTAFLSFVPVGLAIDLSSGLQPPFWWVLAQTGFFCTIVASALTIGMRKPKALRIFLSAYVLLIVMLPHIASSLPSNKALMGPGFEYVRWRLKMDGLLVSVSAGLGYTALLLFVGTQGVRHVRVRTELELAEELQQTLAPPLADNNAEYEIQGKSMPSSQMGGDLLDAVNDGDALTCYVADVAGHGIQAGVFMGMVKSSTRTALLRPGPLEGLLADLNRVLFDVKAGSTTYVTFAGLRCRKDRKVEYALAGHGPILHYHARSKSVSLLAMEQFPLGLFANATFESGITEVEPGDVLVVLTDGLPEVTDARDEQFGLERISEIVARKAGGPLGDLTETLFASARQFGRQTDDETLVLARVTDLPKKDLIVPFDEA